MPAMNTLSNLFSNIQNAELRNKSECLVIPSSKLVVATLNTMKENNYVGEFEVIDDNRGGKIRVQLLGKINRCGIISPRFSVSKDNYSLWERRFLPAVGIGILIVSTPNGVMTHNEAEKSNVGGRILGYVY
jgi:small subunit ribosomal protein S8|tara:strand:+ start:2835 stop:3227 length:393 start_codon:yes stop_codon:yes gene_type:complete